MFTSHMTTTTPTSATAYAVSLETMVLRTQIHHEAARLEVQAARKATAEAAPAAGVGSLVRLTRRIAYAEAGLEVTGIVLKLLRVGDLPGIATTLQSLASIQADSQDDVVNSHRLGKAQMARGLKRNLDI